MSSNDSQGSLSEDCALGASDTSSLTGAQGFRDKCLAPLDGQSSCQCCRSLSWIIQVANPGWTDHPDGIRYLTKGFRGIISEVKT